MLRPGDRAHAVNAAGKATGTAHSPMSGIAKSAMVSTNVSDKVSDSVRAASNTAAGPAPAPLPPSRYLAERMLSTAERLVLTSTHRTEIIEFTEPPTEMNQRDFRVPIDEPVFKPLPAEVVLQNCVPFQTYEVLLSFRNVDKVGLCVRVRVRVCCASF